MVETRSGKGATAQTSFWAIALLLISLGIELARSATDLEGQLVGLGFVIGGILIIFAKYYLKLPDVSEQEMMDTIAVFERSYTEVIERLIAVYEGDIHAARDEIVAHRRLIEATAAMLPAVYQAKLKDVLDALEHKYKV